MTESPRMLAVAGAGPALERLERALAGRGHTVFTAKGIDEALRLLESTPIDIVVVESAGSATEEMALVRHVRENHTDVEVVMIAAEGTVKAAVAAIKSGAAEYLMRPCGDAELLAAVDEALERQRLRQAARPRSVVGPRPLHGLLGESEVMRPVLRAVAKAAASSATVFIAGESGTGKELIARAIHYSGPRSSAPFVAVNCGAIPEGLLESELFGYVKGAFTGASESRAGFFQTADGGTIFLDEISETSPAMQVKLLRVLQDKQICMVGTTRSRKVDVRIVASTNRDPLSLVEKDVLREDLYYRLNVISITIPPLRERGDDVLVLVNHFAKKFADESGRPAPVFSPEALRALREYTWPGNVRELENVIQSLVVMAEGETVDVSDLPSLMRYSALRGGGSERTLAEVEVQHIRAVLQSVGGNRSQAARILGIDRKTLRERLRPRVPQKN